MTQHPLLAQANHPWRPYETERGPFDHRSPGPYSTITPARTSVPTHMPTALETYRASRSMSPAAVPLHHHRQQSAYVLSSTLVLATVGNIFRRHPSSSQIATVVAAAETEASSSSWIFESAPPPHIRSLYATVPLPPDDSPCGFDVHPPQGEARISRDSLEWPSSSSLTTPPFQANPNPRQFCSSSKPYASLQGLRRIDLHPFLNGMCIIRSPPSAYAPIYSPCSSRLVDWAQVCDAPATTPSVGYLTLVIYPTGQTTCVLPTSSRSPHIVTVGDVLDMLEGNSMTIDDVCRGRCGSTLEHTSVCEGERLSVILNCLQLWWETPEGTEIGPHPWQVVVWRC